jgi:FHA domain
MSSQPETLTQQLRELHCIAESWNRYDSRFEAIAQDLTVKQSILTAGKPLIQCVSSRPETAQALKTLLEFHRDLAEACHIESTIIPQRWSMMPVSTASLILQDETQSLKPASPESFANRIYALSAKQPCLLGRHPDCTVPIPDHYRLVSGRHASIRFEPAVDPTHQKTGIWQIHDTSRNGTYVNGHPIQDRQPLERGDRITLGFPQPSETAPLLLFDGQYDAMFVKTSPPIPALECEILCLIVQAHAPVTPRERDFFAHLIRAPIPVKIVLLNTPSESKASPSLPPEFAEILETLDSPNRSAINCLMVSLTSSQVETFVQDSHEERDRPNDTDKFQVFLEELQRLVNDEPANLLNYRLRGHMLAQIQGLESLLMLQKLTLSPNKVADPNGSLQNTMAQIKKDVDYVFKTIDEDQKKFFQKAHERLKTLKNEVTDDYLRDSISSQIKRFSDQLKPVIIKRGRKKLLQIRYVLPSSEIEAHFSQTDLAQSAGEKSINANIALMHFCQTKLGLWVEREWDHVCNHQAEGGIRGLADRMVAAFTAISHFHLDFCIQSSFQPRLAIAYHTVFNENFTQPIDETPFQEPSPVSYTLKKIRSQWMQFIFLFSFVSILGIAGRRQIMHYITDPIVAAFSVSPWISSALALALVYLIVRSLRLVYQDDRQFEREKEAQKLRDKLCSHYQNLVRNRLVDRLIKVLATELDVEKQRLESIVDSVRNQIYEALEQFELNQQIDNSLTDDTQKVVRRLISDQQKLEAVKKMLIAPLRS